MLRCPPGSTREGGILPQFIRRRNLPSVKSEQHGVHVVVNSKPVAHDVSTGRQKLDQIHLHLDISKLLVRSSALEVVGFRVDMCGSASCLWQRTTAPTYTVRGHGPQQLAGCIAVVACCYPDRHCALHDAPKTAAFGGSCSATVTSYSPYGHFVRTVLTAIRATGLHCAGSVDYRGASARAE